MDFNPLHRRDPVLSIFRRTLANEARMWTNWAIFSNDPENPEKLAAYVQTLRRADNLKKALTLYLP